MSELRDIFAYALPSTIFIFGAAVFLLLCAAAVMWPRNHQSRRRHDDRAAGRDYTPAASSIIHP